MAFEFSVKIYVNQIHIHMRDVEKHIQKNAYVAA